MIWMIVVSVLILLIGVLLILPVVIEVNSDRGVYRAHISGLINIQLLPGSDGWKMVLRLFWWKKEWTAQMLWRRKQGKTKKSGKRTRKLRPATVWRKARRLLASFQIKRFRLIVDTDDYILNAYLYPVFIFLTGQNRYLAINFIGRNSVDIFITNRMWKVVWALIGK
ncbi:MAG: hypothetical protein IPL49_07665 [Saprospirales bacterium]|nr:hypothetical protein [Saprospirales bacterium]MBK8490761.1 hypothetical protein [Saprospirales bacterium]